MRYGDTKPTWHVVTPDRGTAAGDWWGFDTEEEARACAALRDDARVYPGVASYSRNGLSDFWSVKRPRWEDGSDYFAPPARRV